MRTTKIETAVVAVCMITGAAVIEYYGVLLIGKALYKFYDKMYDKIFDKLEQKVRDNKEECKEEA